MNRIIKFRAWDGGMFHNVLVDGDAWTDNLVEDRWHGGPVMQFTGLKDKNGVDIYEGDVIDYGSGRFCPITYEKNKFGIKFKNGAHEGCWLDLTKFEVIGNIYEHPKLLNP